MKWTMRRMIFPRAERVEIVAAAAAAALVQEVVAAVAVVAVDLPDAAVSTLTGFKFNSHSYFLLPLLP